jgi:hypothetical protein
LLRRRQGANRTGAREMRRRSVHFTASRSVGRPQAGRVNAGGRNGEGNDDAWDVAGEAP